MKNGVFLTIFMLALAPCLLKAEEVDHRELIEAVQSITGLAKNLEKTGQITADCSNCLLAEPDKKVILKNKTEDLGIPTLYKDNVAYLIQLKRTKDSPKKTTLKFKNGHSQCGKVFMGANPYNGAIIVDCLFYQTVYEDEEIDLNFKQLPALAEGEEQIIELKIIKPKVANSFYAVEANVIKGNSVTIEKDKKFWGSGYNLDFSAKAERQP